VPDEYKPMLFCKGARMPFPEPTKDIKPPSRFFAHADTVSNAEKGSSLVTSAPCDPTRCSGCDEPIQSQRTKVSASRLDTEELMDSLGKISLRDAMPVGHSSPLSTLPQLPARSEGAEGIRESASFTAAQSWRLAMRSAMWLDLPERRSNNLMRDVPISRWENAAWRIWAKQSKEIAPGNLRKKMRVLQRVPCLLCVGQCTCLRLDGEPQATDVQSPSDSVAQCSGPPPGLEECLRVVPLESIAEDAVEDASREAAKRRLCSVMKSDEFKRAEYKLWRRLTTSQEEDECQQLWPATPSEFEFCASRSWTMPLAHVQSMCTMFADPHPIACFSSQQMPMPDSLVTAATPLSQRENDVAYRDERLAARNAELEARVRNLEQRLAGLAGMSF